MRHIHVWPSVQALDVFAHQTPLHDLSKELPTSISVHIGRSLFVLFVALWSCITTSLSLYANIPSADEQNPPSASRKEHLVCLAPLSFNAREKGASVSVIDARAGRDPT